MDEWWLARLLDTTTPTPEFPTEGLNYEVQISEDAAFSNPRSYVTSRLSITVTPVVALKPLWVRVRVFGQYNAPAPWSHVETITPGNDPFAPDVPSDVTAIAGYRLVGLKWPRITAADLRSYQVRWALDDGTRSGPNTDTWSILGTLANNIIITGLDIGTPTTDPVVSPQLYWFQVRAVDTSGNVKTSATDATLVNIDTPGSEDKGWSEMVPMAPAVVGTEDLAVDELIANMLSTGEIDASLITTGTLTIGKPGTAAVLEVRNTSGALIGRWDHDGILILDPNAAGRAVWIAAGEVRTTNGLIGQPDNLLRPDPVGDPFDPMGQHPIATPGNATLWTNSITAEGINASAITFGINPGGHNNLPNSGFELTQFTNLTSKVWTAAADWGTAIAASSVNVTLTGTELTLTSAVY